MESRDRSDDRVSRVRWKASKLLRTLRTNRCNECWLLRCFADLVTEMGTRFFLLFLACATCRLAPADERVIDGVDESMAAPHGRGNVYAPHLIRYQGEWLMYFGGQGRDGHDRIHLATSDDREQWRQEGVVFAPRGINHVNDPSVVVLEDRLFMFYTRARTGITDSIGLATSRDGRTWIDQGSVLLPSPKPAWDSLLVGRPSVMHDGEQFRMWYDGRKDLPIGSPDQEAPKSSQSRRFVGYATSVDGRTWKKHKTVVFGDDSGGVNVTRISDQLVMLIESRVGTRWATSQNGIQWKARGVLRAKDSESPFGHVTPFLHVANGSIRLYYGAALTNSWDQNSIYSIDLKRSLLDHGP